MRAPPAAVLAAALLLAVALGGCIQGAFRPAEIPSDALAPGWSLNADKSSQGEEGLPPLIVAKFRVNVYEHLVLPVGAVYVITVSDVPVVDEQGEISKQLQARLQEAGVTLSNPTAHTGRIGGNVATYTLQDAQVPQNGVPIRGRAIDAQYVCAPNAQSVRVFGFAATQTQGIVGLQDDLTTWNELVGSDPGAALAGMVPRVTCS